jgi:hypothetical protein
MKYLMLTLILLLASACDPGRAAQQPAPTCGASAPDMSAPKYPCAACHPCAGCATPKPWAKPCAWCADAGGVK